MRSPRRSAAELVPGDSIAVNGVCLTVTQADAAGLRRGCLAGDAAVTHAGGMDRRTRRQSRAAAPRRCAARRAFRAGPRRRVGRIAGGRRGRADTIGSSSTFPRRWRRCDRQGLDRDRRHQPDDREARRDGAWASRSCRSRLRIPRSREAQPGDRGEPRSRRARQVRRATVRRGRKVSGHEQAIAPPGEGTSRRRPPFAPIEAAVEAIRAGRDDHRRRR